jgi:hypothetical protein
MGPLRYARAGWSLALGFGVGLTGARPKRLRPLDFSPFATAMERMGDARDGEIGALVATSGIAELRAAMDDGTLTSEELTIHLLRRIRALDGHLGSVIELDPAALDEARAADARRAAGAATGSLDGIPVTVKDNIETAGPLRTTAGSMALAEHVAAADAPVVVALRGVGAVHLGKTNLSELAGAVSRTAGVSVVGGRTVNPSVDALRGVVMGVLRADILAQKSPFEDTADNPAILARIDAGRSGACATAVDATLGPAEALKTFESGFTKVVLGGVSNDTVGYLAAAGTGIRTLADLHAFNRRHPRLRMPTGQFFLDLAMAMDIGTGHLRTGRPRRAGGRDRDPERDVRSDRCGPPGQPGQPPLLALRDGRLPGDHRSPRAARRWDADGRDAHRPGWARRPAAGPRVRVRAGHEAPGAASGHHLAATPAAPSPRSPASARVSIRPRGSARRRRRPRTRCFLPVTVCRSSGSRSGRRPG